MSGPVFTELDEPDQPRPVDREAAREQRAGAHAVAAQARELAAQLASVGLRLADLRSDP
jgi:hypothetical protein